MALRALGFRAYRVFGAQVLEILGFPPGFISLVGACHHLARYSFNLDLPRTRPGQAPVPSPETGYPSTPPCQGVAEGGLFPLLG